MGIRRLDLSKAAGFAPPPHPPSNPPSTPTRYQLPPPSAQQQAVMDWTRTGKGSLFVEAVAGSGKSTLLLGAARYMEGPVALAAFNKSIAVELTAKARALNLANVNVNTFHSFGLRAWNRWRDANGFGGERVRIDAAYKTREMLDNAGVPQTYRSAVSRLVSIAKGGGVGIAAGGWTFDDYERWISTIDHFDVVGKIDEDVRDFDKAVERLVSYATTGLHWASECGADLIDFDDMLWLPLLHRAPFYAHRWVVVDEAQDTSLVRRLLAERMVVAPRFGGRTLWVGDRHQAIYGFSGADNAAIDSIIEHFECAELPLSVTYRCSKAATAMAQQYVPQITAHEANLEGRVERCGAEVYFKNWYVPETADDYAKVSAVLETEIGPPPSPADLRVVPTAGPGDVVLCRYNKPLAALAFALLRAGKGCYIEGRDIGKSLEHLLNKWKVDRVDDLVEKLLAYRKRECDKLRERERSGQLKSSAGMVAALKDKVDTLLVLCEGSQRVSEVKLRIQQMFCDSEEGGPSRNVIVLSSVHKAKGREWNRVFILGFNEHMPSKWATKEWERVQESNLIYVAVTRARDVVVLTPDLPSNVATGRRYRATTESANLDGGWED